MTTAALDGSDVRRWGVCAVVVLGLHASAATMMLTWQDLVAVGEPSDAVVVDLAPFATPSSDTVEDLPAGPNQEEVEAPPPPKQENAEQTPEEKVDPLPTPAPSVAAVPPPEPITPEPAEPSPLPDAPATTAPPPARASQAQISKWQRDIVTQLERHKAYPRAARERGETGIVQLAFSIDREGHLVSSAIVRSSGYAALDQETIATVRRAQPFPVPPAGINGAKFDFTVPMKFNIR